MFKEGNFHDLESSIFTSLYNIGIQSENNYQKINKALRKFISENTGQIENVNLIFSHLQKMEKQMYMNKSQSYTIEEAIEE